MASETTTTAELLQEPAADVAPHGQSDSIPEGDPCTMETECASQVEPACTEEESGSVSITEGDPEDAEWAVVKQCLSVFVIEVYQCKLCASFNSTQKATVTSHLKEKHPTEWMILKDADNSSTIPGGSETNAISRGDLEEMVEKELTDGNQKKSKEADKMPIICVPAPTNEASKATQTNPQTSTQMSTAPVSAANTQIVTAISRPLLAGQYSVVPIAALRTPVLLPSAAHQVVTLQQQNVKLILSNAVTSAGANQSAHSAPTKTQNRIILPARNTGGEASPQGRERETAPVAKSSPMQPRLTLRPVLRRNAKSKPREFKDFVVSVPGRRENETDDSPDEDGGCQDDDVDGAEDNNADEDYVPEDDKDGEGKGKENARHSEQVLERTANRPRKKFKHDSILSYATPVRGEFQCEKCMTRFRAADALARHGKLNRCVGIPITSKEFPCDQCDYKGGSVASLKIHRHVHLQRKEKKFCCASCKKGFTSIKSLRRHRRGRCSALKIKKPKTPKTYSCEECEKVFKYKKALRDHMATHSEIRCFKCDGCTKSFKTHGALRRHRKKHKDNFVYCDQCNFKTRWASSLKTHFQAHHVIDDREFIQCPECSYQTQNKYYLRRHLESHLDVRPFICEICGKNFKTQVILNTHLETHKDGEYRCTKCDYVGKTRVAVYAHQLVHLPRDRMSYKCEQCDWVGKRKSELRMHYRKHSSLKMYHCEACGKSYKHKHALTRHMKERHLQKQEDLSTLEAEEEAQSQAENTVLDTVQEMLDSAQMGLRAEETHAINGIQTILGGPPLKSGLNMQQYQVIQVPQEEEEVGDVEPDQMVSGQSHVVIHDPRVPVAQFFEISTSDGAGDGHLPVHTAQ